jgi:uncharacterized protein YnzC (UPF0291/DUF896 family)
MVTPEEIKRINELAKKAKTEGLSEQEKQEQQVLRQKYIDAVKASLRANLESIRFVDDQSNGDNKGPVH